jgi:hypothetical protein
LTVGHGGQGTVKYHYRKEPVATLNQDPPVATTYYTCLDTTEDVRLIWVAIRQINDETNAKDVNIRITIDGITLDRSADLSLANNTWAFAYLTHDADGLGISTTAFQPNYYTDMRGLSVKVEMKVQSAVGTNQKLDGRVQYETLQPT